MLVLSSVLLVLLTVVVKAAIGTLMFVPLPLASLVVELLQLALGGDKLLLSVAICCAAAFLLAGPLVERP